MSIIDPVASFRAPKARGPAMLRGFAWFAALRRQLPEWYRSSPRSEANPRPWPLRLDPARTPVFVHNEIFIEAPEAKVFALLTGGEWPRFYPNGERVQIPVGRDGRKTLGLGTEFQFTTFGLIQKSQVYEYEENRSLAWRAESSGGGLAIHAFHRWLLLPDGNGTRVITEEIQTGPGAYLGRWLCNSINTSLHASHQLWLEGLKRAAE